MEPPGQLPSLPSPKSGPVLLLVWNDGSFDRSIMADPLNFSQCSTTGVTKDVICTILCYIRTLAANRKE